MLTIEFDPNDRRVKATLAYAWRIVERHEETPELALECAYRAINRYGLVEIEETINDPPRL